MAGTFPLLKWPEIIACMRELSIPVTEKDLKSPEPALIRGVIESFVELLIGTKLEDLNKPHFSATAHIEHMELHDKSIANQTMHHAMLMLMTACGISDFSLKDIITPTAIRVRRILSAIINFAKFREERLAIYQELIAETDVLMEQKCGLEEQNEELAGHLHTARMKREAEVPKQQQLEGEVEQLTTVIQELNRIQAALQQDIRAVKDEMTEVADQVASEVFKTQTVNQENEKLRAQIVPSPERLKREISQMTRQLESDRKDIVQTEKKARQLAEKSDKMEASVEGVLKVTKVLGELGNEVAKLRDASRAMETKKDSINAQQQELKNLTALDQQIRRQITMAQEKMERLTRQQEMRRATTTHSMENIRTQRVKIDSERHSVKAQVEATENEIQQVAAKIASLQEEHVQEMQSMQGQFADLCQQVGKYHTGLRTAMAAC